MKNYVATLGALAFVSLSPPAQAHSVADWVETAAKLSAQEQRAPGPPDARIRAQVALAMFEAANAVEGRYASYLGIDRVRGPASTEVAVARAAYDVLAARYPTRAQELQEALELARDRAADLGSRKAGETAGSAAAAAVLARPAFNMGDDAAYVPAAVPGRYVPTDLPVLPPRARLARPYFSDASKVAAAPPLLTGSRYGHDAEEVRRLGGKTSAARTPTQTAVATFWARQDILAPLRRLTEERRRPLVADARTYALVLMAADDASNAVATAKLDHGLWRPVTAIRNGHADGNARTAADPGWEPLLRTPPHPEYPCGHCIVATTFATLVAAEFGEDAQLRISDATIPAASRTLTPREMIAEVSFSRILAGAHFRFSAEAGETMGRFIALQASHAMPPAHEE